MSIVYESTLPASVEDVFAWHERPGGFARLLPPWQPMRVVAETESLGHGEAVLGLPLGLRWVARHRDCVPERRFVDDLVLPGLADGRLWSHVHEFEPLGEHQTRMTDRVTTPVPRALLEATFAYRHRQLADDLVAHATARDAGLPPLTVAVTGSSGLVGSALVPFLTTGGHRVIRLVRGDPASEDERRWNPDDPAPDLLDGVDAVIHLAGAPIAGRFSQVHKRKVRDSRVGPTRRLAKLAARARPDLRAFVSASAIGFYGPDRGDEVLTEDSEQGDGFIADLVADWEADTAPAADAGIRTVRVRTGIVQSPAGGVLQIFRPIFTAGLGGPLASGRQWMSWIAIDDLLDLYHRALWDDRLRGPVNGVAPEPCRNEDYTTTLARVLHRPAVFRVPSLGPRAVLGAEGAEEFALADQRVVPYRLRDLDIGYRHPTLRGALAHVLGKTR